MRLAFNRFGRRRRTIFLSYRREDSLSQANALALALERAIPGSRVFQDIDSIPAGADFAQVIQREIERCDDVLILIGHRWIGGRDASGLRRLDDPRDYVRLEVAAALTRGVNVIPILLDGVTMPPANELPDDIAGLTLRNAFELRDRTWRADVRELARNIGGQRDSRGGRAGAALAATGILAGVVALGWGVVFGGKGTVDSSRHATSTRSAPSRTDPDPTTPEVEKPAGTVPAERRLLRGIPLAIRDSCYSVTDKTAERRALASVQCDPGRRTERFQYYRYPTRADVSDAFSDFSRSISNREQRCEDGRPGRGSWSHGAVACGYDADRAFIVWSDPERRQLIRLFDFETGGQATLTRLARDWSSVIAHR